MGKSHTAFWNSTRRHGGSVLHPRSSASRARNHRHQQALAERHPEISFILDETVEFSRYRPPPKLIRALNVLRQYPPHEVASIRRGWLSTSPGDVLLTEGTTDRDGDTLAMWCQGNEAPSTLVFGVTGRRGFAPNQLRAVLPNDLRWLHPKPAWLERLFEDWTLAWATTDASEESLVALPEVSNGSARVSLPGFASPQPFGRADSSSSTSTIS